ncbi:MAG: arsenate reductase (glutaredoxin) [Candidatus Fluviicola riflensis]|nr:MAG: arsenate reductase (glutaredoxin) [Candidatus Fluviicola riflensis]OGS78429.1 MAG: arsenate reductase (glutaredoxin) [Candidatus Fluviicola riflensis]OGS85495.1 MAG: arsenate reductase (glutaredoxin) [Fluviicola sp. RIFCSPHIGHO2_01_FULL_43_53]OGS87536.1 MAG: arsenate reductase (glutaredoxin) [Fluviicola sp. RIFCSPHIGHO2_12_FULL_43_24]
MADEEKIQIYHNAMCSKSREGMCMLEELGDEVEIVEYTKNPLTEEQLSELIAKLGIRPKQLVRTKEEIYKTKFADRKMTPKQWIKAMIKYPELMERPIVVKGNKAVIGRPPTLITELIQS